MIIIPTFPFKLVKFYEFPDDPDGIGPCVWFGFDDLNAIIFGYWITCFSIMLLFVLVF